MNRRLINDILTPISLDELNKLTINEEVEVILCNIGLIQNVSYKDTILGYHAINAETSRGLCEINEIFNKLDCTDEFIFNIKRTSGGFNLYKKNNWGLMSTIVPGTNIVIKTTDIGDNVLKFIGTTKQPKDSGAVGELFTTTNITDAINSDNYMWEVQSSNLLRINQSNGIYAYFRCNGTNQSFSIRANDTTRPCTFNGNSTNGFTISYNNGYANIKNNAPDGDKNDARNIKTPWFFYHLSNIQPNKSASGNNVVWDDAQTAFTLSDGDVNGTIVNHNEHVIHFAQGGSYLTYNGVWSYGTITANSCWFIFKKM